uniref:Uncharacterized protein n=1 Tax=Vibrio sp. FF_304 TaxID=1652833 RepID=A0A0H3ZIS2_9VIBR|nr:hypothetical protein [Vibrio sp. FF_304]
MKTLICVTLDCTRRFLQASLTAKELEQKDAAQTSEIVES